MPAIETNPIAKPATHWSVRINYKLRTASFAIVFIAIGAHFLDKPASTAAWIALVLQFLLYPHAMYWRARTAVNQAHAERTNMVVDIVAMGVWTAALHFPLWISFAVCISSILNVTFSRGAKAIAWGFAALLGGALVSILVFGFHVEPQNSWTVTAICMAGVTAYLLALANTAYSINKQLSATRKRLTESEQSLQTTNAALQRQLNEIGILQTQLSEQAIRDPLTGLYNRRYLDTIATREIARCKREAQCLSVLMIDLDHFKRVNDTYGHQSGDEVLKRLAQMLQEQVRATDVACRFGGEEFLLLMPNMPIEAGLSRAMTWLHDFAEIAVPSEAAEIHTTLSVGVATYPLHGESIDALIRCADIALYRAKEEGRNRAVAFEREAANSTASH